MLIFSKLKLLKNDIPIKMLPHFYSELLPTNKHLVKNNNDPLNDPIVHILLTSLEFSDQSNPFLGHLTWLPHVYYSGCNLQ